VLRNLFSKLIDEEIIRDEAYKRDLLSKRTTSVASSLNRPGAPTSIALPPSNNPTPMATPGNVQTPRAQNGYHAVPPTPGLAIGAATPGLVRLTTHFPPTAEEDTVHTPNGASSVVQTPRISTSKVGTPHVQATPSATEGKDVDYFSSSRNLVKDSENSSESGDKAPKTPGLAAEAGPGATSTPTSPTEEKKKGLFGKKFGMSLTKKMSARASAEVKSPVATTGGAAEEKSDTASMRSSDKEAEKTAPTAQIEDNFFGTVQKIRLEYDEFLERQTDAELPQGITPSMPIETPILMPPPHTTVIIQEDNPESGGLADQYRGEIRRLGEKSEVDVLERIAPMWLGDLLLRVSASPSLSP
jgi:WD repeat-containing protein 48